MEATVVTPINASSFSRHFSIPYEQVKDQRCPEVTIAVDVFYCRRTPENESIRLLYCSHALNHSLRCQTLVSKNNEKEKQFGASDSLRDQGFHRARTLILAPTKEAARRIVHTFFHLMPKGSTVSHRRRFERDFGPQPGDTDKEKKKGNSSDNFRIGMAFSKKSVKLYSAFRDSDIILASPLGIKTVLDDEVEKEADVQYIIASIELLIIDQAEMLLMQNWATVQQIVSLLNQRPTVPVFASAARIRLCYLAGYGKRYRQTLLFSAVSNFLITLLSGECESMNYIPPLSYYPDLYPTFLPDWVRVPGLKASIRTGQKRQHSDMNAIKEENKSLTNYNFKLHLISFVVPGQISVKSSCTKLVIPGQISVKSSCTKLLSKNNQSDSDDEIEISPKTTTDNSLHCLSNSLKIDSSTNSLLLSTKTLGFTDYAYL
ncbi:U3 small nucleolar RNA-associated protein 25 [Schistosoma bovis]|uniref:U3 small nucleolar RNA-associated protein 25 homolog n=1 Tax=Schistosoma bovis TaxID=6184 RepID=A0A430Q376_SCHBO|nr:U3 small nucleolar RNA-associated protein 25 [Schistosoma bovis]